jgi:hypothetical protein
MRVTRLGAFLRRIAHDLEYIRRQSFWFDLEIALRTVFGRGARQRLLSEGQTIELRRSSRDPSARDANGPRSST